MSKPRIAPYYSQAGLARAAGAGRSAVSEAIRRGVLATVPTIDGVALVARADGDRWLKDRKPGITSREKGKGGK